MATSTQPVTMINLPAMTADDVLESNMFVIGGYIVEMHQMRRDSSVNHGNVSREGGSVKARSVFRMS